MSSGACDLSRLDYNPLGTTRSTLKYEEVDRVESPAVASHPLRLLKTMAYKSRKAQIIGPAVAEGADLGDSFRFDRHRGQRPRLQPAYSCRA